MAVIFVRFSYLISLKHSAAHNPEAEDSLKESNYRYGQCMKEKTPYY